MSMKNSGLPTEQLFVIVATVATIVGVIVMAGVLYSSPPQLNATNPTVIPTIDPTASPTTTPTTSPTASQTPNSRPTTSTSTTQTTTSPPSPTPTPEPVATAIQNATIFYNYNETDYTLTWAVNGTLINTETTQGISGLTITVFDATNSSLVYGTIITDENGYFEYTFDMMQPPSVDLIFAGNDQYIAATSSAAPPQA
jgi:hypothetical protein